MENNKPGILKRIWTTLRQPSAKYSLLTIVSVSFIVGILCWVGFEAGLASTANLDFCMSCHEMADTVGKEYKQTIHYTNRTGVRAICPDCHTPKPFVRHMLREAKASLELLSSIRGVINTQEKFDAKRMEMATGSTELI